MQGNEKWNNKIEWSALEYEDKYRSPDWFWALGIIIVTSSLASIIYGNYFFAALLLLGGGLLGFFAHKKPEIVFYELNDHGLRTGSRLFPYENIKSFYVQGYKPSEKEMKSMFFIKSERAFMPVISMPTDHLLLEDIRAHMLDKDIPEEEMHEHPSEKIMEVLGF